MSPRYPVLALLLLASAVRAAPAVSPDAFAWRQPLLGPFSAGGLYRAPIPPELQDGCARGPGEDLRIYDESGREWPFFIWTDTRTSAETMVPARRSNEMRTGDGLQFDLDLSAEASGGHEQVRLEFPGDDYIRRVEIFGRETPGAEWGQLGAGYAVRIPRNPVIRDDTVGYAFSSFRHLRIRILKDSRRPEDPIESPACTISRRAGTPEPRTVAAFEPVADPGDADQRESLQTLYFRQRWANPVVELRLSASGAYARDVTVYSRPTGTNAWLWAGGGRLTRKPGLTNGCVTLRETRDVFWRVDIERGDDPPLEGVTAEGGSRPRWLVFEARQAADSADCRFGSDPAGAPAYDLSRRSGDPISAHPVRFGDRAANADYQAGRNPPRWLVPVGVALAGMVLLAVVLSMARDFLRPPSGRA
jgi:hypothetical protein